MFLNGCAADCVIVAVDRKMIDSLVFGGILGIALDGIGCRC